MIKFILFLITGFFFLKNGFAQQEVNNWYFGYKAGLSFASGTPINLTDGQINTGEGCSTISDSNGNLLFYTDGVTVYNRNHQVMLNGTGLFGDASSSQSAIAFPLPGNDSIYYIFTVNINNIGLNYSVINMNHQGGLGEIIQKNIHMLDFAEEKLNAVRHCNNKDVWVLTQKFGTDTYYAYLVTSAGITLNPVVSYTGNVIAGAYGNAIGIMKCSPDGKKMAAAHARDNDYVELMDFNNQTGQLTNIKKLSVRPNIAFPTDGGCYGLEFSNDSKILYVSSYYDLQDRTYLHQFDLNGSNQSAIQASRFKIDSQYNRQYGGMQLGPDGKIYITELFNNYLSKIDNPNSLGTSCNFQPRSVYLGPLTQNYSFIGLPTFLQSYLDINPHYSFTFSNNCSSQSVNFQIPNSIGLDSAKWNFGDVSSGNQNNSTVINPTHYFSSTGIYNITLIAYKGECSFSDTIKKTIWVGDITNYFANDTTLCEGTQFLLKAPFTDFSATYLWNDGSTDSVISINQGGLYWVDINLGNCLYRDSVHAQFNPVPPKFGLGNDTSLCIGHSVTLTPHLNPAGLSYVWNNNSNDTSLKVDLTGIYWLKLLNVYGCSSSDTIHISFNEVPVFNLGRDTSICASEVLILSSANNATSYLWNTGVSTSSIIVNQTGIYWAEATKDLCVFKDTIQISVTPLPMINLGNDTTLCEGMVKLLNANNAGAQFLWQDGSIGQTYTVNKQGNYSVRVISGACSSTDSIKIAYILKPNFRIEPNPKICTGQTLILKPEVQDGQLYNYLWDNGSVDSIRAIDQPGIYRIKLSNICGSKEATVNVTEGVCKLYVPTAFTPNSDNLNDVFKALTGENVISFKMEIYDRWGQKMFQSTDLKFGWNGMYKAKIQPNGIYIWLISYKLSNMNNDQLIKGTVLLVR